jgi:hypothetical protein
VAIAFDAVSNCTTEAIAPSWTHTPVGTPRGVLVYIDTEFLSTDVVSGDTYGGVAMTEVSGSPLLKATGEIAGTYCYFLGASIPTGAQTVAVTNTTQNAWARCVTVTGAADIEVVDTTTVSADSGADPSGTLSLGGRTCYAVMGGMSGIGDPANITPVTGWTSRDEYDFGAFLAFMYTKDATDTADITFSLTMGTDDINMIGVAISEIVGGGDPEGQLIGGKLISGLLAGVLVN